MFKMKNKKVSIDNIKFWEMSTERNFRKYILMGSNRRELAVYFLLCITYGTWIVPREQVFEEVVRSK